MFMEMAGPVSKAGKTSHHTSDNMFQVLLLFGKHVLPQFLSYLIFYFFILSKLDIILPTYSYLNFKTSS